MTDGAPRDARHAQVLAGVGAVVRDHGIEQVTLARVAAAAGVSEGLVLHYHRTPEDLLIGALDAVSEGVCGRVDQLIAIADRDDARIEERLVGVLSQLLPLSSRRIDEVSLVHAVAEFARDGDELDAQVAALHAHLQRQVAAALEDGKLCGEVDPDTDSDRAASESVHLVDGLAARLLVDTDARPPAWATDSLADAVAALCPGECFHGARID